LTFGISFYGQESLPLPTPNIQKVVEKVKSKSRFILEKQNGISLSTSYLVYSIYFGCQMVWLSRQLTNAK